MAGPNQRPNSLPSGSDDQDCRDAGPPYYDSSVGGWVDGNGFSIGPCNLPQVVAANGYANDSVSIALQAAVPSDYASFNLALGEIVDLRAFANAGASATLTSNAASQGLLTLSNGNLAGSYTASMTIDVSAYIASINAKVTMRVTDNFQLALSGKGYVGASITSTSASGGTVTVATPSGGTGASPGKSDGASFDLARFAASVIDTGKWNIAFVASQAGESLQGRGTSVLTIDATVELPGGHKPEVMTLHDTERESLAFNDMSSRGFSGPYGFQQSSSGPLSLFHNA